MSEFERNLREALARRTPPEGFARRATARAIDLHARPRFARRVVWAGTAAALILAAILFLASDRAEHRRAEQAKQEVLFALRVAGRTLNEVEAHVRQAQPLRIGEPGDEGRSN